MKNNTIKRTGKCLHRLFLLVGFVILFGLTSCGKNTEQQIEEQLELGQRYLTDMNYEEAILAFHKVIELEPKSIKAYTGLISAYSGDGQTEKMMSGIETGLDLITELTPDEKEDAMIFLIEANALCTSQEDWELLQKVLELCVALNPEEDEFRTQLADLMEKQRKEKEMQKLLELYKEVLEKLYNECRNGSEEEIWKFLQSAECKKIKETMTDSPFLFPKENGKALGLYPIGDFLYLYYGDVKTGKREGYGQWYQCYETTYTHNGIVENGINYYKYMGEWSGDYPNGEGVEGNYTDIANAHNTEVTGTFLNGKEHGNMKWVIRRGNDKRTFYYTANEGIVPSIGSDDEGKEIMAYAQEDTECLLRFEGEECGLRPFSGHTTWNVRGF